jgi:hypothetical protein
MGEFTGKYLLSIRILLLLFINNAIARALADFRVDMYDSLSLFRESSGPAGSSPKTDDIGGENTNWSRLQLWLRLETELTDEESRKRCGGFKD